MLSAKSFGHTLLQIKFFGLVLGLIVFVIFLLLNALTFIPKNLETKVVNLHFILKQSLHRNSEQENVIREQRSPRISKDIIIVGIDNRTLDAFGRWPFPRSHHANLLNSFTRIQEQSDRESSILLDILFNDVATRAFDDVLLLDAIKQNGRVALQSQISSHPLSSSREKEQNHRLSALLDNYGEILNIQGDLSQVVPYYGIESPLIPYGKAIAAYGHASYKEDYDKVYRRQQIVSRYSQKIGEIPLHEFQIDTTLSTERRGHLGWSDKKGLIHAIELPLTEKSFNALQRDIKQDGVHRVDASGNFVWYLSIYQDYYIPASTLSLALEYFNSSLDDLEVYYGSHIRIPNPMHWNPDADRWEPYTITTGSGSRSKMRVLSEIRIPIDENANMLINFMGHRSSSDPGGIQTYPIRSYSAYANSVPGADTESWPRTKKLGGKIIMVGAFTSGMADDEKTTPLGLMFGVEIHANALNTIIMNNFIWEPKSWINATIMLIAISIFAFLISRMKNIGWSIIIVLVFTIASFLTVNIIFERWNLALDWANPILAVLSTYFLVTIYRVLTAERDKKQIKNVFGQFISPAVVDELTESPPELGGENVDITVFFSDIRGFSRISEQLNPQELVILLNDYLTDMTNNLVNDFNGTLDKYIGDAIMAFWGAPRLQEDHAIRACKCAIMQIRLLDKLNERIKNESGEGVQRLDIGIGLNSGECMVGYMGSAGRKNYTAMGDTVNLASRLEGVNKTYHTHILISEDTWNKVKHEPFIVRELDEIRVKGRLKPVSIYELLDYDGELMPVKPS